MMPRTLAVVSFLFALTLNLLAGPRDEQWKKVEAAAGKDLPKTAAAELEPIIAGALADHHYAEASKAIARKIVFEGEVQGNKAEERITRLEAELARVPAEMKPAMEVILAHWYWSFFNENRWRFVQRTQTATAPGADILAWDLARILAEIDRHFTAALADEAVLKQTPVSAFDDLLQKGSVPDAYRPTVYDFLAYEALQFYQAGEQGVVAAEDAFVLEAASPVFAPAKDFTAWQPVTTDSASPLLKAIRLYQSLLTFHRDDPDRSAYFDADLARLAFSFNSAQGENPAEAYKSALRHFISVTSKHEISARARAVLATRLYDEGAPDQAWAEARRGLDAFRESVGGAMCFNLIQQIEAKSARLDTEHVWNAPWPTLNVAYRNLTKVWFRAIPISFDEYVASIRWGNWQRNEVNATQGVAPALEWSADLPPTPDYRERTARLPAPTNLKPGFYAIIAGHQPGFVAEDNQIIGTRVWVSDLALVTNSRQDGRPGTGFVLNANRGAPLAGATIRSWHQSPDGSYQPGASAKTDANGRYEMQGADQQTILLAEHGGHAVATPYPMQGYNRGHRDDSELRQTIFFTDRALYRPGQTINYKGICFRTDPDAGKYSVLARQKTEVVFQDANGKEIARATQVTNDYGSFSGVFTAPRDRVMGYMSLVAQGPQGSASFRVEEYKRPKFEVAIAAPAVAAKLNAAVDLVGHATAYTGAAIGGARVKWRVERGVQLPAWCWWWQPPASQAVAHGTAVTEADGSFKIQFTAAPDRTVPEKNEPVFYYSIHADVTDTTGETRSSDRGVAAGYTALQAFLGADEWQTSTSPVALAVSTQSLDGVPQAAAGTLTIHALVQPAQVERAPLDNTMRGWRGRYPAAVAEPDTVPSHPDSWANGPLVARQSFRTDASGTATVTQKLPAGIYRVVLETKDRFGKTVTSRLTVEVFDPASRKYRIKVPNRFVSPKWSVEPGDKFTAFWGTGYDSGRAFVELECAGELLKSYWTDASRTQEAIELPVTEAMRGGVTLRVTSIRENRAYFNVRTVQVPWSNKVLTVKWEKFRSKLLPGQAETWTATVTGPDAKRHVSEMVATLYDASLDQYQPHSWPGFNGFRYENSASYAALQNAVVPFEYGSYDWHPPSRLFTWSYRTFPGNLLTSGMYDTIVLSPFMISGGVGGQTLAGSRLRTELKDVAAAVSVVTKQRLDDGKNADSALGYITNTEVSQAPGRAAGPNLNQVVARKNLSETAFFFPHLLADQDGVVKMQFTMPEALTQWKFLGFAHDKQLRAGFLTGETVTAKDLMVEPNPPRFVREGDTIEFTVKVSNQTSQPQTGRVRLTFADAATLASVDAALGNRVTEQDFTIPAKQSRSYSWRISVPDGMGFLTYKAVGATDKISDGEENFLPVLSRRILVTESLPLPIRGKSTKEFDFKKLLESGQSDTLRHQSLTVQMVSQPAWYAVQALPYLMEFPHECSEQLFNRYYANALARHIANSNPKIRRIFDLWKNKPALDSPLAKNQDLKSVMLEETPWLRHANQESAARRNVGLLFDENRLNAETARTLQQIADRQSGDGLWSWFPGGRSNEYISLYIATGFGRLRLLGVDCDITPALKSLAGLDAWMHRRYLRILHSHANPENYQPDSLDALYLYGRSFFLADQPVAKEHQVALDFFLRQSRLFWTGVGSRQSQGHLALALQRFGDATTPADIVKSLKERSVTTEELGMFWRDLELNWWWYHAPIETQAMMIEVFAEVAHDAQAVEDCKAWLLKQKQTQDWKTTKATADAIYSLLLQGDNLLASDALVEVSLAGVPLKPEHVEAGTGFYEQKFGAAEIKPAMGHITVKKTDDGVSWGSAHWQYLEDVAKVTPHEGTPLTLKKSLWLKETTKQGQVLKPVTAPIGVGDELVVRIELRTDRDMEYVHLKDQRGSGTEPVNVLSEYHYQDGLAYYESTRDTASHFYIDYLPKGTYVFEYSTRVQLKGRYQSGIAEIQSMYAPEFNSHSASITLDVQ